MSFAAASRCAASCRQGCAGSARGHRASAQGGAAGSPCSPGHRSTAPASREPHTPTGAREGWSRHRTRSRRLALAAFPKAHEASDGQAVLFAYEQTGRGGDSVRSRENEAVTPLARGVRESACVYSSVPADCSGGNKRTIWRIRVIWQLTRLRIGRYTSISFRQHKEIWSPGTRCSPEAANRLQHHGDGFRGIDADAEGPERGFAGPIVVGIIFGGSDDV